MLLIEGVWGIWAGAEEFIYQHERGPEGSIIQALFEDKLAEF